MIVNLRCQLDWMEVYLETQKSIILGASVKVFPKEISM